MTIAYDNLDRQAARDRDEERRMFPGVPDPEDIAAEKAAEKAAEPTLNLAVITAAIGDKFAAFVEEMIGEESVGDPVPALISSWWHEVHGERLYPGLWMNMLRANRVDPHSARRGDVLRFQYAGTYDRYWHGVILAIDAEHMVATVAVAQSLRETDPTELRKIDIEYHKMRGFSINSSWPATSIIRLVP